MRADRGEFDMMVHSGGVAIGQEVLRRGEFRADEPVAPITAIFMVRSLPSLGRAAESS
jgi:hypothetical protein